MSPVRAPFRATVELPLVTGATTWVAMFSWRGFTADSGAFLAPLLLVGLGIALSGAALRWRRSPDVAVVAAQLVVGVVLTSLVVTGGPWPGGAMGEGLSRSFDSATTYAAPVPHHDGVTVLPLLIMGGAALMLLVDVIACTLVRVPMAGLPLLAVYSVPVGLLGGGLSWGVFALTSLLFLLMLFLQQQQQVGRWGRALASRSAARPGWRPHNDAVRVSATTIGAVAVAASVIVPLAIPTLSLQVFAVGPGAGDGSSINITNPMVDLRRDLRQGRDVPLIRFTTDDPHPSYLRISVLDRFSDEQWSSGDRQVPSGQRADGRMPALQGVGAGVPRTTYDYNLQIDQAFNSTWLPTQAPVSQISAAGDWRYDTSTMDFIASDDHLNTAGESYSMTAVDLDLTAAALDQDVAAPAGIADELTALPDSLPPVVQTYAFDVTANARTPFQQAVALQNWFRTDGHFTYSLARSDEGNSADELASFLDPQSGRVGYCEQFAAAMATMARALDIPARVAVGFLSPDQVAAHTFVYSAHDLHAWPELYFQGAGWVRFDPTPAVRVPDAPTYTNQQVPTVDPSSPGITAPTTTGANPDLVRPSSSLSDRPRRDPAAAAGAGRSGGGGFPWGLVGGALGGLAALTALGLLPRSVRSRRRRQRLAGDAEDAWAELRATALDLGVAWPDSRSPRATRTHLVGLFGRPGDTVYRPARGPDRSPAAVAALDRVVLDVERSRYARSHDRGDAGALREDVELVSDALTAGVSPRTRRGATWWPRSLWVGRAGWSRRPVSPGVSEPVTGGVVEHM